MKRIVAALVLCATLTSGAGEAEVDQSPALKGLKKFSITAQYGDPKLQASFGDRLVVSAELEARKAGIEVVDYNPSDYTTPYVVIKVGGGEYGNVFVIHCEVTFYRLVLIPIKDKTGEQLAYVTAVWGSKSQIQIGKRGDVVHTTEAFQESAFKKFLVDFLKANPIKKNIESEGSSETNQSPSAVRSSR